MSNMTTVREDWLTFTFTSISPGRFLGLRDLQGMGDARDPARRSDI